ncbi:MAG TPA: ferritin-like domain-containing protein [Thermodesulfobacteriota bacterium]
MMLSRLHPRASTDLPDGRLRSRADEALVRLAGGVFWYGEARGAETMARWLEEARRDGGPPEVEADFIGFLAGQVDDERRHAALWADWLVRRGIPMPPGGAVSAARRPDRHPRLPSPPRSIVRLMDWQDDAPTWAERLTTTHLTIEALSLHLYAALRDLVDPDTGAVLAAIHADEGRHVSGGAEWARRLLRADPRGVHAARRAVSRAMWLNLRTVAATVPLLVALGVDVRRLATSTSRAVPRRLRDVGIEPPRWTVMLGLAGRRQSGGTGHSAANGSFP